MNPRILFADDDPDSRKLVKLMLSSEGFEVVDVGNPEDALNLAKAVQFDAFLFDYWMPHLSGIDLCQQIRRFDRHTPIVFYSAAAYKGDRTAALLAGAQGYVTKPSTKEELVITLFSVMRRSSAA